MTVVVESAIRARIRSLREAMAPSDLDAVIVAGSEYTGFEGSVAYLSGFQIVHRYAYVVVPLEGDPYCICPLEARYVGEHGASELPVEFAEWPGRFVADAGRQAGWSRVGVYGLDYIMPTRDFRALEGFDVVPFDMEFDMARAVKSPAELESVRDSVAINQHGFEIWVQRFAPDRSAAEVMASAERYFVEAGCGRRTMNMVLTGDGGRALPEFKIARADERLGDFVLPSLEVAGPGGHWVEISRAVASDRSKLTRDTQRMMDAYTEYWATAVEVMKPGITCHELHVAISAGFAERGYSLGHVTGHSIGMTMIEHPRIGEGIDVEIQANMVFSMHPHAIAPSGEDCLYMQETWLVTPTGGEPLSTLPMEIFEAKTH
jgi:Xaa-Pro aminopeptidase